MVYAAQALSGADREVEVKMETCLVTYNPHVNPKGKCGHSKPWHATFSDCNYGKYHINLKHILHLLINCTNININPVKCAFGLGKNIGTQHWGCCYSVDQSNMICSKSGPHE